MNLEISCPYHGEIEILDLPDSYVDFEGEVACALSSGAPRHLKIKVASGLLIRLERSQPE